MNECPRTVAQLFPNGISNLLILCIPFIIGYQSIAKAFSGSIPDEFGLLLLHLHLGCRIIIGL